MLDETPALIAARNYVARGWRPFPVAYRDKHPVVGIKWGTATASVPTEKTLEWWFGGNPVNIGLSSKNSGLVFLDDDTGTGDGMENLCAAYGQPVPVTYRVRTAKGWHWYLDLPDGVEIANAGKGSYLRDEFGFDVRGNKGGREDAGGYVVAAGSVHESGFIYTAEDPDAPTVPLPDWLLELLLVNGSTKSDQEDRPAGIADRERRYTEAEAVEWVRKFAVRPLQDVGVGGRNDALNVAACVVGHFVPTFWDVDWAVGRLTELAEEVGLDSHEIGPTIRSGLRKGMEQPYTKAEANDPFVPASGSSATDDDAYSRELQRERIRRQVRAELDAEGRPPDPGPSFTSLAHLLVEPDDAEAYRVGQLWPSGGKVLLSAPQKSGKTTLVGNLIRSLADGARFLSREVRPGEFKVAAAGFETVPLGGRRIALFDFEMTRRKLRGWLRDQRIANPDLVHVEFMRGRVWDVRDPKVREVWAERLNELNVGIVLVDPIGPVLGSLNIDENENTPVTSFLFALDALAREANVDELFVTHHTGHGPERARGASAFLGWPDANWTIVRDEMTNARAFKAEGRDVWVPETTLVYDRASRRLGLGEGDRASARSAGHAGIIAQIVKESPGESLRGLKKLALETEIGTKGQHTQDAVRAAEIAGFVHVHLGPNRSRLHFPERCSATCHSRDLPLADPP